MLVHSFHNIVCSPSASLLYLLIREALLVHVAGEEVPELVDGEARHTQLILQDVKVLCEALRLSFVDEALLPDQISQVRRDHDVPCAVGGLRSLEHQLIIFTHDKSFGDVQDAAVQI